MKLLELFSGTHTLSDVFKAHGWEAYTVDWDPSTDADLHADIGKLVADDIIELCGGVPDVVWASPDCTTYSVAALGKHRRKEGNDLIPQTDYARQCDLINIHVMNLLTDLILRNPALIWFIENPRGAMRKMPWLDGIPRYTVTYCQYGERRMKPTDIWTNHLDPQFKPPCHNGDPCHERAPRGSKTGTQGIDGHLNRAQLPEQLCEHIFEICSKEER
jgi:hypothetical protein